MEKTYEVVIVGGGFAGVETAKALAKKGVSVLLIDRNNYHQFQPLIYQVATAQIGISDVTRPLRGIFRKQRHLVRVLTADVTAVDAASHTVTTADGATFQAKILVLATGAVPNFFNTPGAEEFAYPLYSITDATRLGTRVVELIDEADRLGGDARVNIVVVGGGPTGVETAGALGEMMRYVIPEYFSRDLAKRCRIRLVDLVPNVLMAFSPQSQDYARKHLQKVGVKLKLGIGVTEVRANGVMLADGTAIRSRLVVWAGGLKAGPLIDGSGLPQGKGGRVDVKPDLTVPGVDGVYVLGDSANITDQTGAKLPQLGSVAQQAGKWAARNIYADLNGGRREPFPYVDKGYMAMVGRGAAVAELGKNRYRLHGPIAFLAWLAVHVALLSGNRQRMRALFSWAEDYLSPTRSHVALGQAKSS
ncbi:NAD(P)/FAD-dependent oxidoreductase [Diaminobutyricimonas sp. TR449]|uniref:NAD(P)/FAD-dependent oxidoreductase n=1 Tax=Diaminobutyricimonas sp. TR449 TaxID=2708076 RepID=UPI0014246A9D|nr:NAD(P)/FAD-dependent oxidoreductase [Diaminobutyricimonas sp. TR449]